VLDMGEPITIATSREQMILLSGKTPGVDVEITFTGLRPGEKLFEELFHVRRAPAPTSHEKILLARFREVDWARSSPLARCSSAPATSRGEDVRQRARRSLVPEFDAAARELRQDHSHRRRARSLGDPAP
jgi:FlaA1/EpsC-like NDP-sugar epimerase